MTPDTTQRDSESAFLHKLSDDEVVERIENIHSMGLPTCDIMSNLPPTIRDRISKADYWPDPMVMYVDATVTELRKFLLVKMSPLFSREEDRNIEEWALADYQQDYRNTATHRLTVKPEYVDDDPFDRKGRYRYNVLKIEQVD